MTYIPEGTVVFSRNGTEEGVATGNTRYYAGFEATERPQVKWKNGRSTYPHPSALAWDEKKNGYKIL